MEVASCEWKIRATQTRNGNAPNNIYTSKQFSEGHFDDSIRRVIAEEMAPDSDLRVRAPDAWDLHYREHLVHHLKTQMAVDFFEGLIRCESSQIHRPMASML